MKPRAIMKTLIIGVAALTLGGCALLPDSLQHALGNTIKVTADFKNIAGVYVGNPVTVLGLEVGTVDKVVPKALEVEVHMTIDADVSIPADAEAAIVSPSIVTNRHIEFTPAYTEGKDTLADGAHLSTERTHTPVELDTMMKTIDEFSAALAPSENSEGIGPLSGRVLYPMLDGNGEKIRDTLNALSGALQVGVKNKDAISTIIIKLNELTTILAENDQSVREFSNQVTQMSGLLAAQAPGLQATLNQLNTFLTNTSTEFGQYQNQLADTLTGLTNVTQQLRDHSYGLIEVADVGPLALQNVNNIMNREYGYVRLHGLLGTALAGEQISVLCERFMMDADGCRTKDITDFGPDYGLTAAMLGLTQ